MVIPRMVAAALVLWATVMAPAVGLPDNEPPALASQEVEAAFRGAMEMWAYREFWRLWEVCTGESRVAVSQNDFAASMDRASVRPAAGRQVEDLAVTATSPRTALVIARIGLEDWRSRTTQSIVRSFPFYYQDGRWRPQLSDFLGLSSYAFPGRPPFGPVPLIAPCCPIRVPLPPSQIRP